MAFSAFFSGMEIAFVSSNKLRFEMGKKSDATTWILSIFYRHPNNFISTMLVGNNIALVVYGIITAQIIESFIPESIHFSGAALVLTETVISTLVILVTGEFLPKTLFKLSPNTTLKVFAFPAFACYIVLYPISLFASFISGLMLRMSGVKINKEAQDKAFSKVDLDYFIQSSIDKVENQEEVETEIKMFQNALDFSSCKIRDCMVPRTEIIAVEISDNQDELMKTFVDNGISKVIVYNESIDNIVGYIHSSEMFKEQPDWRKGIRSLPIVPETMAAHKLMKLFMQQKRSLAVVVDEFGGTSGIVALEDLVEEILGDIEDEHDIDSTVAKSLGGGEYILSGRLEIEKANDEFGLDLPESDDCQTIGGFILHEYQSIPKAHEVIEIGDYQFKMIKVTATRIELVRLKVKEH